MADLMAELKLIFGKPAHKVCLTMASLKTKYLLFLAAFLFLSAVPTAAEVVESVVDCKEFLLKETPPHIPKLLVDGKIQEPNRYKPICQTFQKQRRFLTLYDIHNKIPVFSAYKYIKEQDAGEPPNHWRIEPQLENKYNEDKNMTDEDKRKTYNNQAMDIYYQTSANEKGFDRGHLFPSTHASTASDKESTMTLTNIVPQEPTFNQGSWKNMEDCIKCVMDHFCITTNNNNADEGFVVTGAKPGTQELKKKVNIPSMLWSAFCCYNSKKNMWIASAHWGDNVPDGPEYLQSQTLEALHEKTKVFLAKTNVFPGTECPLDKKLSDYPEIEITQTCSKCKSN